MAQSRMTQILLAAYVILSVVITPVSGTCSSGVQADMVFVLDASGSVGSSNFQTMLSFVQDLVNDFDIGSNAVRVGVQKFSSSTNTEFNLNTYYDKTSINNAVANIYYSGGTTNTGGALEYLRTNMFTSGNGDRSGVTNIGVVMSDGVSNDGSYTATQAAYARNAGITLFSIGIGSGIPMSELNEIATDPDSDHVFAVSSFSALDGIKSSFQAQACPAVNGNWGSWGSWGSCSLTCGSGSMSRSRSCDNPAPSNGGSTCSGSSSDSTSCNTQGCPVDGNWGSWGSWGSCTLTCGSGSMTRTRNCDSPSASNGGAACSGSGSESTSCNTHSCPIDGNWATWTSWGTCSTTCELGSWSRSRTCTNPSAQHGGASCSGSSSETTSCDLGPCPIDGAWGSWQSWSACSVTCKAIGVRSRIRNCDSPAAQYGGAPCPGSGTESESCDYRLTLCSPGNGWAPQIYATTAGTPVNGGFGNWGQWSSCSKTCGAGSRVRTRQCNSPVPRYGGTECSGDYFETEVCNNVLCSAVYAYTQSCPANYFDCASGAQCIHYLKRCDCEMDCADGSDELVNYAGCTSEYDLCTNAAGMPLPRLLLIGVWTSLVTVLLWLMVKI